MKCLSSKRSIIAPLVAILLSAVSFADIMDDFGNQPEDRWEYFGDDVMGGVSTGSTTFVEENGTRFVRLQGSVSVDNNGGFIQVRREISTDLSSNTQGFELQVRGNGERYFLHLRSNRTVLPWQYYQAGFDTTEEWQTVRVGLGEFKRSGRILPRSIKPKTIKSIAIVAYGREHKADVSVSRVSTY